ncbi:MAG: lysophospholipid acyltransferase family protein [Alistipes sp.]|nr:lysophospholipid acyltransferase family protein [Alistipes sp.]
MKNTKPKLSLGSKCLWLLCRSVAIMPHWYQYGFLTTIIYAVMRYVVRYRRALILQQLSTSFPEKSDEEIDEICNEFYRHLAEVVICTMSLAGITDEQRRDAVKFNIPDDVREALKDKHFIILASHHGFWEYAQFVGMSMPGYCEIGAYHPLSSKAWDDLFLHLRSFEDVIPISSKRYLRYFVDHKDTGVNGKPMMLGMASDQNAPPKGDIHWYNFLNQQTLFFEGGEQLATRFNLPVVYFSMQRQSAGRYHCDMIMVYDGQESVEKHEITERYVRLLEKDIQRDPARWLWSHRRWKFVPDPETGAPIKVAKRKVS